MFRNLESERLLLKNISRDDRDFIYKLFTTSNVNKFLFDLEPLTNTKDADKILDMFLLAETNTQHRWVLIRKSDNVSMGTCGFHL